MRTIPHRELRNNSSRILDEVKNGEIIEVTNHGEVVAVLIPPTATPYDRLVAAGRVRLARPAGKRFADVRASRTDRDAVEVLAQMRDE
jgi:prevent-host-death family protein